LGIFEGFVKIENILVLFGADSKLEWGRSFQLAKAFHANGHNVMYVDLPDPIRNTIKPKKTKDNLSDNGLFHIYKPKYGLPYGRIRILKSLNREIIFRQVISRLLQLNFSPTLLWVYSPYEPEIARKIKDHFSIDKVIYDCADDRVALARLESGDRGARMVEQLERELCAFCTCIVSITENLRKAKKGLNRNIIVIPNGIDTYMFSIDRTMDMPDYYRKLPGRIILYAGTVVEWIDQELMIASAKSNPNDSFVFVGPIRTDVTQMKGEPNIYFLGNKDYSDMPSYMAFADLCVIPFKDNSYTRVSYTLKSLQYLAMGRHVLSTWYDGVNDYKGLVKVAESREEFVNQIGTMLEHKENHDSKTLLEVLKAYSWKNLAAKALKEVFTFKAI
jgi:glycosyltransferase involved in cell wall biosynthesis